MGQSASDFHKFRDGFWNVSQEFRDLGLKPNLYSITPITPMLNPRRKDMFESPEIRFPTFDAKALIFEIRVPRFGLRPSMLELRSSRSEFRC